MKGVRSVTTRVFNGMHVVNELLRDCRQSTNGIAETCHMSKQRVWRKIKALEDDHTVWGYSAVVDDTKLGYDLYMALIKGGPTTQERIEKIIERHKNPQAVGRGHAQLIESYYTNGVYDWIVVFSASSIAEAKKYCGSLQTVYGEFIKGVELLEVMLPVARSGILNPEIDKLREFAIPNGT